MDSFFSVLFPSYCDLCHQLISRAADSAVCLNCWSKIQPIRENICQRCGDIFISTAVPQAWQCGRCRRGLNQFDSCRSYAVYEDPIREIVHRFKYGKRARLGPRLAGLLYSIWLNDEKVREAEVIVPVPLHRQRERARGFNQSTILARCLSRMTQKPFETKMLIRSRATSSQTGLSHRQRRQNVSHAFEVKRPDVVRGKVCLVIDDVFTTGATLNEIARTLKQSGAKKVVALTLARVSARAAVGADSGLLRRTEI